MKSLFQWSGRFLGWTALALALMANNSLRAEPCPASQTCAPPARMIPPPPTAFNTGYSTALNVDFAVTSSPNMRCATIDALSCGAAYVFQLTNGAWVLQTRLVPSDETPWQRIGDVVVTSGNFVMVSAREDDGGGGMNLNYGAVYVFQRVNGQWLQVAKLTAYDAEAGDEFGNPLAVSGNVLVAGARADDCTNGLDCGSAYVYRYNGQSWQFEQKLQSSALNQYAGAAGISLAVDQNTIAFGAPWLMTSSEGPVGGVVVYGFNGASWTEDALLQDDSYGNLFGSAVALAGNRLAVVAPGGGDTGAVFMYEKSGTAWTQSQTIVPSPQSPGDGWGLGSLAFQYDTLVCTSPNYPCPSESDHCGLVYVFREGNNSWSQIATIRSTQEQENEHFGFDVSLLGTGRLIVGAPGALRTPGEPFPSGAAYYFDMASLGCDCAAASCEVTLESTSDCDENARMDDCEMEGRDCNGNLKLDACDLRFGGSNDNDNNGIPDECGCLSVAPVAAETAGLDKSRFISFVPGNPGHDKAIRVTLRSLHHVDPPYGAGPTVAFTAFEGQVRWVGPPSTNLESTTPGDAQFVGAQLQCMPHFGDWSTIDILHVMGSGIIPSSEYEVQIVGANCNLDQEESYSPSLLLRTTRWGDAEVPYSPPSPTTQPDITDISVLVNKFKNTSGAPIKARALLAGNDEFGNINLSVNLDFSHISACVDAFRGKPYPYTIQSCP